MQRCQISLPMEKKSIFLAYVWIACNSVQYDILNWKAFKNALLEIAALP